MLRNITLFSNHTATGSIYNSPVINVESNEGIGFYVVGAHAGTVGSSWSVWFEATPDGTNFTPYYHVMRIISTADIAANYSNVINGTGTIMFGMFQPDEARILNKVRVKYEMSAQGSAAVGTMSGYLFVREGNHIS